MTSPLPPRRRDTRSIADRVRQDRENLNQLYTGFMGGRFPPLRRLGSPALLGDLEDDTAGTDGPLDLLQFVNDDTAVWSGTGDLVIALTHVPWSDSLQVKLNGHELEPSEWSYSASLNTVTIPAEPWWESGEKGTAYYAYLEGDDIEVEPIEPDFVAATHGLNSYTIPLATETGNLLVAVAMLPTSRSIELHGWTSIGESDAVTHAAHSGTYTYKLAVMVKVYDGSGDVPTFDGAGGDVVLAMAAFAEGTTVSGLFDTVADSTSAATPAAPSSLRVWGTIGDRVTATPESGTVVVSHPGSVSDVGIYLTTDTTLSAVAATADGSAGWCLATLAVQA